MPSPQVLRHFVVRAARRSSGCCMTQVICAGIVTLVQQSRCYDTAAQERRAAGSQVVQTRISRGAQWRPPRINEDSGLSSIGLIAEGDSVAFSRPEISPIGEDSGSSPMDLVADGRSVERHRVDAAGKSPASISPSSGCRIQRRATPRPIPDLRPDARAGWATRRTPR